MGVKSPLADSVQFKILTDDNKITIFDSAKSVTLINGSENTGGELNSVILKNAGQILSATAFYNAEENKVKRQLIKYFLDDYGKINTIYTAKDNFEFECIPVTEYNDDGTKKTSIMSNQYTEEDFLIRRIERIDPTKADIYVNVLQ